MIRPGGPAATRRPDIAWTAARPGWLLDQPRTQDFEVSERDLPTGTAYAVWVGIGASLTVVIAMVTGAEAASWLKVGLILTIVASVVGLKLAH